ncbi:oligoendopeptidase F [Candidatus Fermentibacterales bacterium]|nr:oligoendopeptidase F [Candidatus Fermentibacterales bacterium]
MAEKPKTRSEIDAGDRWAVEELYREDRLWEEDFGKTGGFAEAASSWAGKLGESASSLAKAIRELLAQDRLIEKLKSYASLREDEDLSNQHYSSMHSRIVTRAAEVDAAQSFFQPELLAIPAETMTQWLRSEELAPYRTWLDEILRYRPYTLSTGEEKILAMFRDPVGCFENAYGKLADVELPARLPEIVDEDGSPKKLTNGNLVPTLESGDRRVRKEAFDGYYGELEGNRNTLAALLDGHVRALVCYARARGYGTSLEASLFHDRVEVAVYDNLIASVHESLGSMHRFYDLKRRVLGLPSLHLYDLYLPMVQEVRRKHSYEEAEQLTLEAVAPLGREYVATLRKGFESGWVDRYENVGKRSGAYSGGCYDSCPYMLMNFQGNLSWVFTLAHEAGHSMHSLISNKAQPYHMADYPILLAEVASTTNEMLLRHLLLERAESDLERAFLLDDMVNDFRSTMFRQTMFAEFEKLASERVEAGEALTPEYLDGAYYDLVKAFHGDAFAFDREDEAIAWEWARIPHFYYNFYVYKYATGLAAAADISRRILAGETGAVERYLEFLSGGRSKPPLEQLREAGVDLAGRDTVNSALVLLSDTVSELEALLGA